MGNLMHAQLQECPAATRLVAALYVAGSVGLPQVPRMQQHFLCNLSSIKNSKYFWTALLSAFYRPCSDLNDVLMAGVELSMFASNVPRRERELGTLRFLVWTLLTHMGTNIFFLLSMLLLRRASNRGMKRRYNFLSNQGLWPTIMVCITSRALKNPDALVNVWGTVIRARWYPISLVSALSLMNGSVQWDSCAAMAYGYAHESLDLGRRGLPSEARARTFEARFCPKLVCQGMLGGSWMPTNASRNGWQQQLRQTFELFSGSGHRLGN